MNYVLEGFAPLEQYSSHAMVLKIKNHAALVSLSQGNGNKEDFQKIVAAANVTEAICMMKIGSEYSDILPPAQAAIKALHLREKEIGKYTFKAEELTAVNRMIELLDAQLAIITVQEMQESLKIVEREVQKLKSKKKEST